MTAPETAKVTNLRDARKEQAAAKREAAKAAQKATGAAARALGEPKDGETAKPAPKPEAKKAAPAKEKPTGPQRTRAEYRKLEGKNLYEATGRGGKINVRNFPGVMTHAVDVADEGARTEAARAGLIYRFFPDAEKAQAFADKKNSEGYNAVVVPAKPYKG